MPELRSKDGRTGEVGMMDREKVIKGLECCSAMSGDECQKCPYGHECRDTDLPYGMPHLAADALDLLKEQEAEIRQLRLALDIAKGTCKGIVMEGR